jgi:dihydrodipicolinate synthase/N-acetylneuraminate lyase
MRIDPLHDLRGIITVLNTPFTEDDQIDLPGLEKNVEAAIGAGVAGFLVPAMASEVGKLSEAERGQLVESVVKIAAGRVPVIGGASAATETERLQAAGRCIELGCEGVLVSVPFEGEASYRRAIHAVAALEPGFLMIQDWDATNYGLPVPLIVRLFEEIEVFRCLKVEVVPAGVKYSEVLEATGGQLHVSGGWAVGQIIEGLDRGVHAFMPTGMHPLYTQIYKDYQAGRRDQARALFNQLAPVLAFSNQHLDISIHFFKRLLHAQGVYATPKVREPILPFDAHHEAIAKEHIACVIALETKTR